jgi:hypothetical protein
MKNYNDFKEDKNREDLTSEELCNINWTKFKIVVPREEDKLELIEAFSHIHYSDINTDFITVNQLAHEYLEGSNIIVDESLYNKINLK